MKLKRNLSEIGLLSTAICSMIGSGWLFGALIAAKYAGPYSIYSWILGGIMVGIIALTFAELSSMLPVAGGVVRYIHFSHGTLSSFCISWLTWLSCVCVAPTEVSAAIHYIANFFPELMVKINSNYIPSKLGIFVSIILLIFITILNVLATKSLSKIMSNIGSWKIMVPILTALTLILTKFDTSNIITDTHMIHNHTHGIFSATSGIVIFSLLGFVESLALAGETRNPQKAIPITILVSVVLTIFVYIILQVSFLGALNKEMFHEGWQNISFAGDFGPFAGIATSLGLGLLANLILVDAVISPLGTGFAYVATTARINYAMSMNKYLPQNMLKLNENGIPVNAIIANFVVGLLLMLPFPVWEDLVKFQTAAIILAYATGPISLLALRKQIPDQDRPFLLPFHKSISLLAFFLINTILLWTGWQSIWRLVVALLIGVTSLLIYKKYCNNSFSKNLDTQAASWLLLYILGICAISYLGSFGGIEFIPIGLDMAVVAMFSLLILKLAVNVRLDSKESKKLVSIE
ncbi:MAG: APC family permease [Pseudomonadota bacterium]|nr:APC family permease [Pseudomonadota bacterium]